MKRTCDRAAQALSDLRWCGRHIIHETADAVVVVDKLTWRGQPDVSGIGDAKRPFRLWRR